MEKFVINQKISRFIEKLSIYYNVFIYEFFIAKIYSRR